MDNAEASKGSPTPLHQAILAAAHEAYGSLLSAPLADKAATTFAEEANAMIEAMIAENAHALRERIETQLSGMTLAKGAKRKGPKPAATANGAATNGAATNGAAPATPANGEEKAPTNGASEVKAEPPAKPARAEAKTKTESKPKGRKRGPGRPSARA